MSVIGKLGAGVLLKFLGFSIPVILIILFVWSALD